MTEHAADPGGAEPTVRRGRLSLVWLIPILAVGLAAYLGYRVESEKGPVITIYFESGAGLEAGKTKVRFKSVEIGLVEEISLRAESPQVVVRCSLPKGVEPHLTEGAEFWVVRPRVGFGGVSGLGTLLSGAYIAGIPGPPDAKRAREFTGLDQPPLSEPEDPGLKIVVHAPELGSLDAGTSVYYRQIRVGTVERHVLAEDGKSVELQVFIDAEHAERVHTNSRFWNSGGIDLEAGFGKLDLRAESLEALVAGGVTFDSPAGGKPAAAGARFPLHASRHDLEKAVWLYGGLSVVVEAPKLGGIKEGDFVYYRDERVGGVVSQSISTDSRSVRIHLNIRAPYASLVRSNSVFWNASGISADLGLTGLHVHTESLEALLSGGVAFATPDKPGHRVTPGSVFELQPEVKDKWLEWSPRIWRGPPEKAPAEAEPKPEEHHGFFHHGGKNEEEAQADGPAPEDHEKHGFFHRLLH